MQNVSVLSASTQRFSCSLCGRMASTYAAPVEATEEMEMPAGVENPGSH